MSGVDDTDAKDWQRELAVNLGAEIAEARHAQRMSAVKLAATLDTLGLPTHRVAIARIEKGDQVVTVPMLIALAAILGGDWKAWLSNAAGKVSIEAEPSADLRVQLAEVNAELQRFEGALVQAEEGPRRLDLPDVLRTRLETDTDRYRSMIKTLREDRDQIMRSLGEPDA
jgi:transcriptional regulator with XRE-family HTH domain